MWDALEGFAIVGVIMAVGYSLQRFDALDGSGRRALGSFVYLVATPMLMFHQITTNPLEEILNVSFVVVSLAALASGVVFFFVIRFGFRANGGESIIGMLAASYANAGNLGIPLAAYVLGNTSAVIPVMLFQVGLYAPVTTTALDIVTDHGRHGWLHNLVVVPLRNPMLLASLAGLAFAITGVPVPGVVAEPAGILAGASVPLAVIVFGMSLAGSRVRITAPVLALVVAKNIFHPLISAAIGLAFGLGGDALFAVIVLGALPTAQNVYTYALRFRTGEAMARDSGVVTTIGAAPVILALAVLFD